MKLQLTTAPWWGAPKKFSAEVKERKISWLELFYDLVYVIAISRITSHLFEDQTAYGFLNYFFLFSVIFWSWMNGSLHYDLHSSEGLRTRLMTLWQILIISVMVVNLDHHPDITDSNTIAIIIAMQLFITYLWWSVGFYDKAHRHLNKPYSILYILSLLLMGFSLFADERNRIPILSLAIIVSYLPPFLVHFVRRNRPHLLSLTSSMAERLGLFAIILFGEIMTGIISGEEIIKDGSFVSWIPFGLSVLITFSLWWLFFTLISDRNCKPGILAGATLEIIYLLTLMVLGVLGMAFRGILANENSSGTGTNPYLFIFGCAVGAFLSAICIIILLMEYPEKYARLRNDIQKLLLVFSIIVVAFARIFQHLSLSVFLAVILAILLILIGIINLKWYSKFASEIPGESQKQKKNPEDYSTDHRDVQ